MLCSALVSLSLSCLALCCCWHGVVVGMMIVVFVVFSSVLLLAWCCVVLVWLGCDVGVGFIVVVVVV